MIRSGARRLAAAVAAVALVALAPATTVASAAVPPPAAQAPDQTPDQVGIRAIEQDPWVTRGGTWSLRLALTGAPAGSRVVAELHTRVADRSEYEASLLGVIESDVLDTLPVVDVDSTEERSDDSRIVSLAVSLNQTPPADVPPGWQFYPSLRPGVYPLDVRIVDADGTDRGRVVVHIVRVPSGTEEGADDAPIMVAPLLTIGAGPTIDATGKPDPDPGIARQVDDLTDGLAMGRGLPFTLVPRPESIEALARDEESEDSLDALRTATRAQQVVDGSYVEVPLPSWVDRGLNPELDRQRDRGNGILTEHLGRADSSTWDARSGLSPAAVAALWPVGVRSVILASGAVGPTAPSGPVTIGAGEGRFMTGVVPDAILSGSLVRRSDPVLAAADFAAELALRASSTDGLHGVVLAPPEGWMDDPANVALLDRVLLDPLAPVEAVTVAELLEVIPPVETRELAPTISVDLGPFPDRLATARSLLSSYASLVGPTTPEVGSLDQRLLLAGSTDLTATEQSAYVEEVLATADRRFGAIRAPSRQTVTLTSSDGEIPLTLLNRLDVPVTVTVEPTSDGRVEIGEFEKTQTLKPGRTQLKIPVHARAPGDATIDIAIRTTDGVVTIDEVDYTVRSTAVPGIGVVLTVGAVAFLLIWWARHWLRDRRTRGDGGGGGGGDDPDDPDPRPDDAPGATVAADPELVST